MGRERPILLPKHARVLETLGENIRLARLRRHLSASQVAERSDISRSTLYLLEKGDPGVSMGNMLRVLAVLGLEPGLATLAADDILGRKLQDAGLKSPRKRAPNQPVPDDEKEGNDGA